MTVHRDCLTFSGLKDKQRNLRNGFPEDVGLHIHRALSWLGRAEKEAADADAAFIFYWIAFNAAYAHDQQPILNYGERSSFQEFFSKLIEVDNNHRIHSGIWERFPDSIRVILNNKFVFQPYWCHQNGQPGYDDWEDRFDKSRKRLNTALMSRDSGVILTTLFDRLYVLRNQLVHGGATWNGKVNRAQVKDGAKILSFLVPIFIDLMMDHPNLTWGVPFYPVVAD